MTIDEAFEVVHREGFLPKDVRAHAAEDRPLPIGYGQTNSQPSTVYRMLEWLNVQPGDKVLDVGSGSGWTTALLAYLTGKAGRVYATEIVPELVDFGYDNCLAAGATNTQFVPATLDQLGLPEHAPYDRILVSASAEVMPDELLDQLKNTGKLVVPVGNTVYELEKDLNGSVTSEEHAGFVFVPLIR